MQFLAYILVYPFLWIISILPFRLLYLLSDGLYILLYYIIGYRKKVVTDNLKLVFPDKSEEELRRIKKKFYKHLCDMFLEMTKTLSITKAEMQKRFKIKNPEELRRLEALNKSIILMYGHYASWEWSVEIQNHINFHGFGVYKKLANKYFDKLARDLTIAYLKVNKVKRGYYEAEFMTLTEEPKKYKDYEVTDIFLREVEKQIYAAPEYYFWTHKRWKHQVKN